MACIAGDACRKCGFGDADLQLGCGCKTHVRCTPLNLIISDSSPAAGGEFIGIPTAISPQAIIPCPFCRCSVGGIKLLPLRLQDLERAVEVRKQSAQQQQNQNGKRAREETEEEVAFRQAEAESSFLLSSTAGDRQTHRTGRWSPEEVQYVDYIISAFDSGTLAIPHGVKLNDLLGEMLMCKSSRLTKKMKNAKLSMRSYALKYPLRAMDQHCCSTLSNLQERFLASVTSESSQLELRFNISKLWRTHFSNLCLQVGYELLDARDWIATLEQMEGKASEAEDHIRKARRRRMSIALRTDVGEAANAGVFIGGMSARDANMQPPPGTKPTESSLPKSPSAPKMDTTLKREYSEVSMSESEKQQATSAAQSLEEDDEFLAALEMTAAGEGPNRSRLKSEDMDFGLYDELIDPLAMIADLDDSPQVPGNCGPFLEGIAGYMESEQIPFQYADVWVPSYMGDDGQATSTHTDPSKLRLFPAGHATRADMDPTVRCQLNEFGSYTAHFSFAPGHGLPGRVYVTGKASWERNIHETDPSVFERAGGANVYGIKTAVGIPLNAEGIGRIVVALYSTSDIVQDNGMMSKFEVDFKAWNPEPKWKLVIDLGNSTKVDKQVMASAVPTRMIHFSHPKPKPQQSDLKRAPVASAPSIQPVGALAAAVSSVQASMQATSAPSSTPSMIVHQHAPPKPSPSSVLSASKPAAAASASASADDEMEQSIASLLGDHMPTNNGPDAALLPHFMSLRLMLLRVRDRRSPEENEKLDILKRSYVDYSKGRTGSELACLLAKDWMFLQPSFGMKESPQASPAPSPQTQQNLAMPTAPTNLSMPTNSLPAYSLPPPAAAAASASGTAVKMIVHQHAPPVPPSGSTTSSTICAPRSRSVSATSSSESPPTNPVTPRADIVPDA